MPVDHPASDANNTVSSARTVSVALEVEEADALLRNYGAYLQDILLAAIGLMYRRWTGSKVLVLTLVTNGRWPVFSDVDVALMVGLSG